MAHYLHLKFFLLLILFKDALRACWASQPIYNPINQNLNGQNGDYVEAQLKKRKPLPPYPGFEMENECDCKKQEGDVKKSCESKCFPSYFVLKSFYPWNCLRNCYNMCSPPVPSYPSALPNSDSVDQCFQTDNKNQSQSNACTEVTSQLCYPFFQQGCNSGDSENKYIFFCFPYNCICTNSGSTSLCPNGGDSPVNICPQANMCCPFVPYNVFANTSYYLRGGHAADQIFMVCEDDRCNFHDVPCCQCVQQKECSPCPISQQQLNSMLRGIRPYLPKSHCNIHCLCRRHYNDYNKPVKCSTSSCCMQVCQKPSCCEQPCPPKPQPCNLYKSCCPSTDHQPCPTKCPQPSQSYCCSGGGQYQCTCNCTRSNGGPCECIHEDSDDNCCTGNQPTVKKACCCSNPYNTAGKSLTNCQCNSKPKPPPLNPRPPCYNPCSCSKCCPIPRKTMCNPSDCCGAKKVSFSKSCCCVEDDSEPSCECDSSDSQCCCSGNGQWPTDYKAHSYEKLKYGFPCCQYCEDLLRNMKGRSRVEISCAN